MIVGIVGSREYHDLGRVAEYVKQIAVKYPDALIVSGGARGVDSTAELTADYAGLGFISYRPYKDADGDYRIQVVEGGCPDNVESVAERDLSELFRSFGRAAFHRNGWIIEDSDVIVAFWDGSSSGTRDSIGKARASGKPYFVYTPTLG